MLSRLLLMVQAAGMDGQFLDPVSPFEDGGVAPEVDIGGRNGAEALVVAVIVIVTDESANLAFKVSGQEVVSQHDAVFQRLMPTPDLTLGLGMIGGCPDMLHTLVFEPVRKVAEDGGRAIATEQPGFVDNVGLVPSLMSPTPVSVSR